MSIAEKIEENNRLIKELIEITKNGNPGLLNIKEAAAYLGLSVSTVRKFQNEIGFVQRKRKILFSKSNLDEWIRKNSV